MAKIDYLQLLEELAHMPAHTEDLDPARFASGFHVVPEHLKAFDPSVLLVLGNRGSGKSFLFKAVTKYNLTADLNRLVAAANIPVNVQWVEGFSNEGSEYPNILSLIAYMKKNPFSAEDFWFAALVRRLKNALSTIPNAETACKGLWDLPGARLEQWLIEVAKNRDQMTEILDQLNMRLTDEKQTILIGYDELDTLVDDDAERGGEALTGLIAFWARLHRRWKALRPKLFLRTDLYRKFSTLGGADLAKLSANRVEIRWSDLALHGVLFKQILNLPHPDWERFLELKSTSRDERLGKVLAQKSAKEFKSAYRSLIGEYMGEGPRKGLAFRWPIEHVRDGLNSAHPRALIELFRKAAELQQGTGKLPPRLHLGLAGSPTIQTLLQPIHLRRALNEVSKIHVNSVSELWPWMSGLRRLTSGKQTPVESKIWIDWLKMDWKKWNPAPGKDPESFLDELLSIGVLRTRPDGRIDASDLYLDGLGLKRRGGVQRRDKKLAKPESA